MNPVCSLSLWILILTTLLLAAAEAAHARAHQRQKAGTLCAGNVVLLVLGHPSLRSGRVHPIQRWRCDIADRSLGLGEAATVIFSGGPPGPHSEARCMATYFEQRYRSDGVHVLIEEDALSTRENLLNNLSTLRRADCIKIVSDPIHCERATTLLIDLEPELAPRLFPAANYRRFEHIFLKLGTWFFETQAGIARRLHLQTSERRRTLP